MAPPAIYGTQRLDAAKPWVVQPTARQLLDSAPGVPTKRHFALRLLSAIPEPRPTNAYSLRLQA